MACVNVRHVPAEHGAGDFRIEMWQPCGIKFSGPYFDAERFDANFVVVGKLEGEVLGGGLFGHGDDCVILIMPDFLRFYFSHRYGALEFDDLIAGPHGFKAVAGLGEEAALDFDFLNRINGTAVLDLKAIRRGGAGDHGLRGGFVSVADDEDMAGAFGTGAPVGIAAVGGDEEVAARCHGEINGELVEAGDDAVVRDVARRCLDELGAVDFAA